MIIENKTIKINYTVSKMQFSKRNIDLGNFVENEILNVIFYSKNEYEMSQTTVDSKINIEKYYVEKIIYIIKFNIQKYF